MARSDTELINEVRALTGYDGGAMFTDSDIQSLVDIGKEELRSTFGAPEFEFYLRGDTNTLDADRALFWFVCIATKVRAGEIGSVELTINNLEEKQSSGQFDYWFRNFRARLKASQRDVAGPSVTSITRTDSREYAYEQPDYGGQ